jgi:flagellar hook-associated protein 2
MGVNGIYGLSGSGIDVESMVKVGMMSKQKEYDKMAQKFTKNEWTKAEYLKLNSSITTFNMSTLSQYKMSATMNAKTAESTSSAIKVTANASAPVMNHLVEVTDLSSAAYLIGTGTINRAADASKNSINLKDILFDSISVDDNDIVSGSLTGGNNEQYDFDNVSLNDKAISFFVGDGTKNDSGSLKSVEISFTYEEVLNGNATLNDLVSKINNTGLNIKANYDTVNDQITLHNPNGGVENGIILTTGADSDSDEGGRVYAGSAAAGFLTRLGLKQSTNGTLNPTAMTFNGTDTKQEQFGTDGHIKVDGVTYDTTDNKATVGGITYTAITKTESPTTVTVSQDVDAIVDKVKSFVADYNKLLSGLYEKYDEKPETGYAPLTQSQKDAMKEDQITKWEEKAQKGLLYHDKTLGNIISEMRDSISTPIENLESKYNSAYAIGISTTGIKGQLTLNEDKLRAALADDSDAVYNVFAKLDGSQKDKKGNVIDNPEGNGIAQRLGDILTTATKNIRSRAGSSTEITEDSDLNTLLRQLQTKMSNFKKMMNSFETALYKKYDAMESTLAKLGTQLNFVMGGNQ